MMKTKRTDKTVEDEIVEETAAEAGSDEAEAENAADNTDGADGQAEKQGGDEAGEAAEDLNTKYLRLAADFQNYKRRMEKERFERYSAGKQDFASDLLPILDNFDRALTQDEELAVDEHDRAVLEGMAMILKQFKDALEKNGVYEIEALGADFDPMFHNAVVMEKSDRYESQKVSEVLLKGYRMGDKVIRYSMVKVAE
jgi:molecular chaperone GrpE